MLTGLKPADKRAIHEAIEWYMDDYKSEGVYAIMFEQLPEQFEYDEAFRKRYITRFLHYSKRLCDCEDSRPWNIVEQFILDLIINRAKGIRGKSNKNPHVVDALDAFQESLNENFDFLLLDTAVPLRISADYRHAC